MGVNAKSALHYLLSEFKVSMFYNVMIGVFFLTVLWPNLDSFWGCHYQQTLWMIILSILNSFSFLPKLLLVVYIHYLINNQKEKVNRLNRREGEFQNYCDDRISESYNVLRDAFKAKLRTVFKCRVYLVNTHISKVIFFTNCAGLFNIFLSSRNISTCFDEIREGSPEYRSTLWYWCVFLFFAFSFRMGLAFVKYSVMHRKFIIGQHGIQEKDLKTIPLETINKAYEEFLREQDEVCCICYMPYLEGETIRKLQCPGKHIYHTKCIDQWLGKKKSLSAL